MDMGGPRQTRGIHREPLVLLPAFVDALSISGDCAREYPQTEKERTILAPQEAAPRNKPDGSPLEVYVLQTT